jgi:protein ImuB
VNRASAPTRTVVVWGPDWPVVAARREGAVPPDLPVAVMRANRVVAASPDARASGVRRGMRRREAQSRCAVLELVNDDPARDARAFEPVLMALEHYTPLIEVVRPGLAQFAARGPSRYFGGDTALIERIHHTLDGLQISAQIGVADGPFAAAIAARGAAVVPPGESAHFLSSKPIASLVASGAERLGDAASHRRANRTARRSMADLTVNDLAELVELLHRLGLRTLGSFAALPATDVLARFGSLGARAHRLSSGLDEHPLEPTAIPPDLIAATELDPPVDRVDTAAFIAKALAEELHDKLMRHGLACLRVRIEAHTAGGAVLVRLWRHERAGAAGGLTAQGLADRVRWQLDGWLRVLRADPASVLDHDQDPGAGEDVALVRLLLVPDEVVPDAGRQLGLWGDPTDADLRAARAFARVQGLLGPDAVRVPVLAGGRSVSPVRLMTWGDDTQGQQRAGELDAPWRGRLPTPLPSIVHDPALPASVLDVHGRPVGVNARGVMSASPASVAVASSVTGALGASDEVTAWAGPWPIDERWWDATEHRRVARLQVVTTSGAVLLLGASAGAWWWEAAWS